MGPAQYGAPADDIGRSLQWPREGRVSLQRKREGQSADKFHRFFRDSATISDLTSYRRTRLANSSRPSQSLFSARRRVAPPTLLTAPRHACREETTRAA